jgi:hypothetical protein
MRAPSTLKCAQPSAWHTFVVVAAYVGHQLGNAVPHGLLMIGGVGADRRPGAALVAAHRKGAPLLDLQHQGNPERS